jgi:hypothetical protein
VQRESVALGWVVVWVIGVDTAGLDNIEREAALQLHAGRSQDGPQRARRAPLLSDHFTDIAGGNMETKDSRFLLGDGFYTDRVGIVDQGPCNLRHQGLHLCDSKFAVVQHY